MFASTLKFHLHQHPLALGLPHGFVHGADLPLYLGLHVRKHHLLSPVALGIVREQVRVRKNDAHDGAGRLLLHRVEPREHRRGHCGLGRVAAHDGENGTSEGGETGSELSGEKSRPSGQ